MVVTSEFRHRRLAMKWFKPKHTACKECGVHFDPVTGYEARWGDLCPTHRKPVMERDRKRDTVIAWASDNWENLIDQAEKDTAAAVAAHLKAASSLSGAGYSNFSAQQANAANPYSLGNVFGMTR